MTHSFGRRWIAAGFSMNETVREWITKAEADYGTAVRELDATERPNYDAVCFHAQQCIEKLMKGLLIHCDVTPPRTHNLMWLDKLLKPVCAEWSASADDLDFLTRAASAFRYPGATAGHGDTKEAIEICTLLRQQLLKLLEG